MITPKLDDKKIVFGPVRLAYVHLLERYAAESGIDEKYTVTLLIPKEETQTIKALNKAIENAKANGIKKFGKDFKMKDSPLHDGDEKDGDHPEFEGHYYINAKSTTKPGVVNKKREPITDEEEVYSGMWGIASISFFAYQKSGNKGVAAGINNVLKTKDDDYFGGRNSAENDFAEIEFDDDDDL